MKFLFLFSCIFILPNTLFAKPMKIQQGILKEKKHAKNILDIYKEKNFSKLKKIIKKTKLPNKRSVFHKPYYSWLKELKKISYTQSNKHLFQLCGKKRTSDILYKKKRFYCISNFLNRLKSSYKDQKKGISLFSPQILGHPDFKPWLKKIKPRKLNKVFPHIIESYKKHNRKVSSHLFKSLRLNTANHQVLLSLVPKLDRSNHIFYHEFKKMFKKVYNEIQKKSDHKVVHKKTQQLLNFYSENISFLDKDYAYDKFSSLARKLKSYQYHEISSSVLDFITPDNYDRGNEEHVFALLWNALSRDNHKEAFRLINSFQLHRNFASLSPKLKFWVAHILKKNEEKTLHDFYMKEIIKSHPLSYYSILARFTLGQPRLAKAIRRIPSSLNQKSSRNILQEFKKNHYKILTRIALWDLLNSDHFIHFELSTYTQKQTKILSKTELRKKLLHMADFLFKEKNFLACFSLLYDFLDEEKTAFNYNFLDYLFPSIYHAPINKYSKNLNPYLVRSLIRQESAFNPKAKSSAGAMGLMQLMPNTAKMISKIKTHKSLYNPELNIKIGTTFLKKLLKNYNGDLILSLAAYNAGKRRVNTWLKKGILSGTPLEKIEKIPFKETRLYVKLIIRNIFFYKHLNEDNPDFRMLHNALALNIKTKM